MFCKPVEDLMKTPLYMWTRNSSWLAPVQSTNTTEKEHFGSAKLLRFPVFTRHSIRITELNYTLNPEQFGSHYSMKLKAASQKTAPELNPDYPSAPGTAELERVRSYFCIFLAV